MSHIFLPVYQIKVINIENFHNHGTIFPYYIEIEKINATQFLMGESIYM